MARPNAVINPQTKKMSNPALRRFLKNGAKFRQVAQPLLHFTLDKGVCAEVRVGREHLRLFSEQNALGVQVSVYNVNAKKWIVPSESVETIEQGKLKAAT